MSIYQRFLSKSLIFFSIFFVVFLFFIKSNLGFKCIFKLTGGLFIGLKTEEISGNWRDFKLKNIHCNISGLSIQAKSIHVILDSSSLFKTSTIFKEIKIKNLIILLRKNISSNHIEKNFSTNLIKNNINIKSPVIFKKININKILFKTSKEKIFFSRFLSHVELINNNIIFFPTDINLIDIVSNDINLKKKHIINQFTFIKNIKNIKNDKKIYNILYFISKKSKIFIPFNINFVDLKCHKINFLDDKKMFFFKIQLQAKINNNILQIKKIKINSTFFNIKSYGKIFFNKNASIFCIINSKIFISKFHKKVINFLFEAHLSNKFKFKLKTNNAYNINVNGTVFLDRLDYPFYIKFKSRNLSSFIKNNLILNLHKFNGILTGKINNYCLFLRNVFNVSGMPSIAINIKGRGNLHNIFLEKIKCFRIEKKSMYLENNIEYNEYILKLIGKIDLIGKLNTNQYNISIPKMILYTNIMKKNFSILGSLKYRNFDLLEIPGISLLAGKNQLFFQGSLGRKNDISLSINANNLEYFLPNLKGNIQAKSKFHNGIHSIITSKILANNINWNSTYFKNIKIFSKININNILGKILINIKNIGFDNFLIKSLDVRIDWNNYHQKINFLLKSHKLNINFIINGITDSKTGNWQGAFQEININTVLGQINTKKNIRLYYYNFDKSNYFIDRIKIINFFSSFSNKIKTSFLNFFNPSITSFTSQLFIHAKLKSISGEKISNGKIILTSKKIKLEKKIEQNFFKENIDYVKVSINLIKNAVKSKWIIKKTKNSLICEKVVGYLDLLDIYNQKNIKGKFYVSDFPFSFINFFTSSFKKVQGIFDSKIKFFGTLYQPRVSADVNLKNIFIRSNNLLKYMVLFFPYFSGKVDNVKINQEIIIKKGHVLFTSDRLVSDFNNIKWHLLFHSKNIKILILPKIKLKFSSELNLYYLDKKYDLIGYIRLYWFFFKINEKNFVF